MDRIHRVEITGIVLIVSFSLLFVCGLFLAQWPEWWKWIIFERTPMTWLESTLLFTSCILAACIGSLTYINKERVKSFYWLILSSGFFILAFDERFAIHERIRDSILAPKDIILPVAPWTSPGDFILILCMVFGFFILYKIKSIFSERPAARRLFYSGVAIAAIAVLLDSWDVHTYSIPLQRMEQFIEELLETGAMLLFFSSLWLMLFHEIRKNLAIT